MSLELAIAIGLVAAVAWYFKRYSRGKSDAKLTERDVHEREGADTESSAVADPFLAEITETKQQSDLQVLAATQDYTQELETRFSNDVQLKERLSKFAREQELDEALIAIWQEVEHYSAWSDRKDISKWNRLELEEIDGSKEGEKKSVLFSYAGHRYAISERQWYGEGGDWYADFTLQEDEAEVFAIGSSVSYDEYVTHYRCNSVAAFKKRGQWAKMLIALYSRLQIQQNKTRAQSQYFKADEIKKRFEE
jgi:hypothetical protein